MTENKVWRGDCGDIGVTMKVYAHASLDEQRKALRRLGDQLS
ncbi:hypothetical protein [Streptomyces sp. CNQ-509]|nr:hypothetical protein [Streptomyces sp. CNQ-509]